MSFWQNFRHCLHWKLSLWQLPVQSVMKISSKWRLFPFQYKTAHYYDVFKLLIITLTCVWSALMPGRLSNFIVHMTRLTQISGVRTSQYLMITYHIRCEKTPHNHISLSTHTTCMKYVNLFIMQEPLPWRHNDHDGVSNYQPHGCLLNRLFRRRWQKTSKLCVTGLCAGTSPGPMNSPHKGPVTRKMFPFDVVITIGQIWV